MAAVTVDSSSQRYGSSAQPEPDVLLLHTTEGMSWPAYSGGGEAPHDTVKPIRGKGIEVRRHISYDDYSRSLENAPGGAQTNRRGVIQVELRGTCDPVHRHDPDWYYWPDADDAVLQALADYYRPIMARYAIPAKAMGEFVAYPRSYGLHAPQRLTPAQWNTRQGIAGHEHAPENHHGDPGLFPIDRFIHFLTATTTPQEDDVSFDEQIPKKDGTNRTATAASMLGWVDIRTYRAEKTLARLEAQVTALGAAVEALATSKGADSAAIVAEVGAAVRERLAQITVHDDGEDPS